MRREKRDLSVSIYYLKITKWLILVNTVTSLENVFASTPFNITHFYEKQTLHQISEELHTFICITF